MVLAADLLVQIKVPLGPDHAAHNTSYASPVCRSPVALPIVLLVIPVSFHLVLLATKCSLVQAADSGWVMQPEVRLPGLWLQAGARSVTLGS